MSAQGRSFTLLAIVLLISLLAYSPGNPGAHAASSTPTPTAASELIPISAANAGQIRQAARLGRGSTNDLAWSADYKILAVATQAGLWLYKAEAPKALRLLTTDLDPISAVTASPDGKLLASLNCETDRREFVGCPVGGKLQLWDVKEEQPIGQPFQPHPQFTLAVAFDSTGKLMATSGCEAVEDNGACTQYAVRLWNVPGGQPAGGPFVLKGNLRALAFSPGGDTLAVELYDTVALLKVSTGEQLALLKDRVGHLYQVSSLAFNRDGSRLAACCNVALWNLKTGQQIDAFDLKEPVCCLSYNRQQTLVGFDSGDDTRIQLKNVLTGATLATYFDFGPSGRGHYLRFGPDGTTLQAVGYYYKRFQAAVWNAATGALFDDFALASWGVRPLFRPDGAALFFITPYGESYEYLLSVVRGNEQVVFREDALSNHVDFSADGTRLALAYAANIVVRDTRNGARIARLRSPQSISQMMLSPDGLLLAVLASDEVLVWEVKSGATVADLKPGKVTGIAFSPDNTTLAIAYENDSAQLWSIKTQTLVTKLDVSSNNASPASSGDMSFSPDGRRLVYVGLHSGGVYAVKVWDTETGAELLASKAGDNYTSSYDPLTDHSFSPDSTRLILGEPEDSSRKIMIDSQTGKQLLLFAADACTFSPDSSLLVSGSRDGTITVWDVRTGVQAAQWKGHTDRILALVFNAGATRLASGSEDGTVRIWGIVP